MTPLLMVVALLAKIVVGSSAAAASGLLGAAMPPAAAVVPARPPKAATLAGDYQTAWDPPARALPTIGNFVGGVGVSRTDVAAFDSFFAAPFAQGMPSMLALEVDGKRLNVTQHRWSPFEIARIADDAGSLPPNVDRTESHIRMPVARSAILLNISLMGTGEHDINLTLTPRVRSYSCIDGWGCTGNPAWCASGIDKVEAVKCTTAAQFNYSVSESTLQAIDTRSTAATAMSIAASQLGGSSVTVTPKLTADGGEVRLRLALPAWITVSVSVAESLSAAVSATAPSSFQAEWLAAEEQWEEQWEAAFSSSSSSSSSSSAAADDATAERNHDAAEPAGTRAAVGGPTGQLPMLETPDTQLARVYYTSALTLLQLSREGGGIAGGLSWDTAHAAATTGECGGPNQYFWDTSFHAVGTSLLEPHAMRSTLLATLETQFLDDDWICLQSGCGTSGSADYRKQCFNMIGKYAFNPSAIFTSLIEYLQTTGDLAFLKEVTGGGGAGKKSVDEWLELLALDWQRCGRRTHTPFWSHFYIQ